MRKSLTQRLSEVKRELQSILEEDQRRHQMDEELRELHDAMSEFCSAVDEFFDYDPTPQYLYDNTGEESAVSAAEREFNEFFNKQALKK